MSIAFKALRAPIERPKLASSRFSFYRRTTTYRVPITKVKRNDKRDEREERIDRI